MSTDLTRKGRGTYFVVLFFATILFIFLFIKSRGLDDKYHTYLITELRHTRQKDSLVDNEVIGLRHGLKISYDRLTKSLKDIESFLNRVDTFQTWDLYENNKDSKSLFNNCLDHFSKKQNYVEQFKSESAIYSNSLRNFPAAIKRIIDSSVEKTEYKSQLETLFRTVTVFERNSSLDSKKMSQKTITQLESFKESLTQKEASRLSSLLIHAGIILEKKEVVDAAFVEITNSPFQSSLEKFEQSLLDIYLNKSEAIRIYTIALNGLSVLVLGGIFFLIFKLKSASDSLEEMNLKLEDEVEERTKNLKESEVQNRTIVTASYDAIIVIDAYGIIQLINPSCERMFSYSSEELIGQNVNVLMPNPYKAEHDSYLSNYHETGDKKIIGQGRELIGSTKDGEQFPIYLTVSEMEFQNKKMFVGCIRDITTEKIREKELIDAKEQAEIAAQARSDFLANMSHEIRTPMNGVIGMAGILQDMELSEDVRDCVTTIQNSGESLLTIINDILDFSKAQAGQLTIEAIPFDLKVAVEEVSDLLIVQAEKKELELIIRYSPSTPSHVIGDPGRIRQVLTNLIGNAIKFTEEGFVKVTVDFDEKQTFSFIVEDTGIGLPKEKINHLFEQFTQADASTTRKFGGTGLGLSICKQLVELMSGSISASNRKEGGACFTFVLPLELDTQTPYEPLPTEDIKNLKILIVDDNEDYCEILREAIASHCTQIKTCHRGQEALKILSQAKQSGEPFHIVVTDYQMPEMNGEELGLAIKSDNEIKDTILVMLTSIEKRGEARRLEELGFAAYLSKPIEMSHLTDTLTFVWGNSKQEKNLIVTKHLVNEQREICKKVSSKSSNENRLRILVVDDNIINQKVARRVIEKLNCHVDVASNGAEGVDLVKNLPFDLVFMDMQMPEMDGLEATRTIRQLPGQKAASTPIVAMTANAMEGDRQKCLDAGMNDYVSKPIKPEKVKKALEEWARKNSGDLS